MLPFRGIRKKEQIKLLHRNMYKVGGWSFRLFLVCVCATVSGRECDQPHILLLFVIFLLAQEGSRLYIPLFQWISMHRLKLCICCLYAVFISRDQCANDMLEAGLQFGVCVCVASYSHRVKDTLSLGANSISTQTQHSHWSGASHISKSPVWQKNKS